MEKKVKDVKNVKETKKVKKENKVEETKITIPEFIPMNELEEYRLSMSIDLTQWYNNLVYAYQREMVKKLLEEEDVKITRSRYIGGV